jgi:hypothetical protein
MSLGIDDWNILERVARGNQSSDSEVDEQDAPSSRIFRAQQAARRLLDLGMSPDPVPQPHHGQGVGSNDEREPLKPGNM